MVAGSAAGSISGPAARPVSGSAARPVSGSAARSISGSAARSISGSAAGASSRMTWALVPAKPNELTPAMRGWPLRSHGTGSVTTSTASRSHGMCGEGFSKLRCRGSISFSNDRMTLMTPAIPAAASRWPMFVLTEPISSGRSAGRPAPSTAPAA